MRSRALILLAYNDDMSLLNEALAVGEKAPLTARASGTKAPSCPTQYPSEAWPSVQVFSTIPQWAKRHESYHNGS